jgi:hypothetical protein
VDGGTEGCLRHADDPDAGLFADPGADAGDHHAAGRLAGMLADRGDLDELRTRADAGDQFAVLPQALVTAQARRPGRGGTDPARLARYA